MHLPLLALLAAAQAAPPAWVPDARFSLALYCASTCEPEQTDAIEAALAPIPARRRLPRTVRAPARVMALTTAEDLGLPGIDALGALADGLTEADIAALGTSQEVILASFAAPSGQVEELFDVAYPAFLAQVQAHGGVVEELATGRLFGLDAFAGQVARVTARPLDTEAFFVVEAAALEEGEPGTIQTYGLRSLGLHELLVKDVPVGEEADQVAVLGALAQIAWEQGGLQERTWITELAPALPAARIRAIGIEGTAYAMSAQSLWATSVDPLARIAFDGRFDADPAQPLDAYPLELLQGAPPAEEPAAVEPAAVEAAVEQPTVEMPAPEVPTVEVPTPEVPAVEVPAVEVSSPEAPAAPSTLEEVLARAAAALAGPVHAAWSAGLPRGDRLYVKAPFSSPSGAREYLWIQVVAWHGTLLEGVLRSDPVWANGLAAGDVVSVQQAQIFDYLWRHADGRSEGNESEALLH
ncbi:MAG: DUF2314 domain-containing protein [Pseudomonadota bacterium]